MSNPENRFNAPKISVEEAEKKAGKKRAAKKTSAEANDNNEFINDPVDAIADKDIEGWTKSLEQKESVDDPIDAIADKDIEGWTKPLEEKPAKKTRTREKKVKQPVSGHEEGKAAWPSETYKKAEVGGGIPTYGVPTPKTEARLNRNVDRDFKEAFEDEMKKSADVELDPEFDQAFNDELKRSSKETWSDEVAELTADVKKIAEEPRHGKNPTKSGRYDVEEALPIMKDQDDALAELAKKNKKPALKKGFWGWLMGW